MSEATLSPPAERNTFVNADVALAGGIAGLSLLLLWLGRQLSSNAKTRELDGPIATADVLGVVAVVIGLAISTWWIFSLALALTAELLSRTGRRRSSRIASALAPAFMRRLVIAALGLSLLTSAPAHASGAILQEAGVTAAAPRGANLNPAWSAGVPLDALEPSWKPTTTPAAGGLLIRQQQRPLASDGRTGIPETLTVAPGDSLWTLAAQHMGPLATDAEVAAFWPRLYEINRHVIGPDPHMLRPGQLLQLPTNER